MALIQVNNLYMGFSGECLFKEVNFSVDEKDKIGIIGVNGAGKSTLIKLLLGLENSEVDPSTNERGVISKKSNLKIGYLAQNTELNKNNTVFNELMTVFNSLLDDYKKIQELNSMLSLNIGDFEEIMNELGEISERYERNEGYSIEYKIKQILNGLNISENLWNLEISKLSGGQSSRVALAKILLEEPDLLVLDEPTNHLDLTSIEWLEKILKDYNKAILLISHDVYFLDNVANRIFEMEGKRLKDYKGNYSDFLIQKEAYLSGEVKAYEKEQEKIKKMEEFIRRYKAGVKSKQARGREKILNRMEKMENPVIATKKIKLEFDIKTQSVDLVLDIKNLSKRFEDKSLFKDVNLKIYRGERIGLIGKNGTGKSTLLKIINKLEKQTSGEFLLGERVSIGYYDQNHQGLGLNNNIIEELMYYFTLSEEEARNICAAFLFREDDIYKKISSLSGGEKARVAFMKLMLEKPNFLILDEPTNHLDIYSREILMDSLESYPGTILVVSHDRNFLDSIVNKIYELKEIGVEAFDGDYEQYKKQKDNIKIKNEEAIKNYEEQKKNRNRLSSLEKKLVKLEEEIQKLELEKEKISLEFTKAGEKNDVDELLRLQELLDSTDLEIMEKLEEWENSEAELNTLKN
ncbi:ABC-F family ATP-binding cassette domain-containing protein [Fusobacterium sp.]|uniref:ABC-F family ATP-binding cassette domain-containing protein n=1 Tax=Fusobacterium TaxID=848 RepID=UPI0025C72A24|nr:ABC-F family ATP-binding cassette domain-containing protein [Fusobacterium sp.]MCI5724856.1 ABC-F family ATP-binding cassette domain-containing protein [Fusobacterium sp.]MDY5794458.1 ABC-F family ATP-binding cassette domain-containing protein [Fusobacterium gastrosuis]